jgi:hypothetical protein
MARAAATHTLRQFSRPPSVRKVASRLEDDMAAVEGSAAPRQLRLGRGAAAAARLPARKKVPRRRDELFRAAASSGKGRGGAAAADLQPRRAEKRRQGRIEAAAPAEWSWGMEAARARVIFQRQLDFARVAV